MYGEKSTELIKTLVRDENEVIPKYQQELIEEIIRENEELYAENLKTSQSTTSGSNNEKVPVHPTTSNDNTDDLTGVEPSDRHNETEELGPGDPDGIDIGEKEIMVMQVRHTAKLWNKRCIIAYHYERLNRLKRLRWDIGNNLPRAIVENLSRDELEWFMKYNENLFSYMSALTIDGRGIDLTLYKTPPKRLYVQVKCLRDYGEFDIEGEQPVMLKKDSIHNLPLNQCEKLIHQGVLQQMV